MILNGAWLSPLLYFLRQNNNLFLIILIMSNSVLTWISLPQTNFLFLFRLLPLVRLVQLLESNMSAPWDSIKTRVAFSRLFDGFCLFWRTNALNSGVLGVEPLKSFSVMLF